MCSMPSRVRQPLDRRVRWRRLTQSDGSSGGSASAGPGSCKRPAVTLCLSAGRRSSLGYQCEKSDRCLGHEGVTSVQLRNTSTRHLPKARLLHREPPVPSCQKTLLLDGVFSGGTVKLSGILVVWRRNPSALERIINNSGRIQDAEKTLKSVNLTVPFPQLCTSICTRTQHSSTSH